MGFSDDDLIVGQFYWIRVGRCELVCGCIEKVFYTYYVKLIAKNRDEYFFESDGSKRWFSKKRKNKKRYIVSFDSIYFTREK